MARAVFTFTKDGRARLAGVLRALLIAQLVLSLCMAIFCYNTSLRVMLLLKHIHKVTVLLLYGLILFQAYGMKLHYTGGLRLIALLVKFPYWTRANFVSSVWLVTGTLVAANGMLVYAACRGTLKALMKELASSLRIGISQYLTEPTWKSLLDTMQVELSCCGADMPSDWHEIPWINMDFLNESSNLVMKLAGTDGKVLPPVSPYSCCTPRVMAPCYHDPLQQSEWREVWSEESPLLSASLHTRGCVEAVRAPLTRALLALQCFNMLVFLFQATMYRGSDDCVSMCLSDAHSGADAAAAHERARRRAARRLRGRGPRRALRGPAPRPSAPGAGAQFVRLRFVRAHVRARGMRRVGATRAPPHAPAPPPPRRLPLVNVVRKRPAAALRWKNVKPSSRLSKQYNSHTPCMDVLQI